ncbi:MAG: hypothetical protein IMW84_02615 [Thermoanaerobacter sp.]|nr:hypothetical protein [Thermoanaerobacter sp.]
MKGLKYLALITAIALFTTMFMLKTKFEEPIYFSQQDLWDKSENQLTKGSEAVCKEELTASSKVDKEDKEMAKRNQGSENARKVRIFKEKMLEDLLKQKNREVYDLENNKKTQKENSGDDNIIITTEKILQVQNEMEPSQKIKVMSIILKLGTDDMNEIMKMAQKGLTQKDNDKIMEILKNKLSSEDVQYLVEIANEYFAKK